MTDKPTWPYLVAEIRGGKINWVPVADAVHAAGFGPVPQRIEVTYCTEYCGDSCTCPLAEGDPR